MGKALGQINSQEVVALTSEVGGGAIVSITSAESPYSANWGDNIEADSSGGVIVINFPTAVGNSGKRIDVTRVNSGINLVTMNPFGSELMNGQTSISFANQYTGYGFVSNGTNIGLR